MSEKNIYRRILRREQFSSRSLSVIVALSLVSLASAYAAVECALAALGQPKLLLDPPTVIAAVNAPSALVLVGAGAAVVFGLVLVVLAITPGRRARHALTHDRMAVIVDDNVLASALGRAARDVASVPPGRVRTTVSSRKATVSVTPTSGFPVDKAAVESAARDIATRLAPKPGVRVGVSVATSGVVGS